jgi:hypothetical protein
VSTVAIKEKNPELCIYLHASVDDACMQWYYENSNDPSVCNQSLGLMSDNCIHHYFLLDTCNLGKGDYNSECAYSYLLSVDRPDYCLSLPDEKSCIEYYFIANGPSACEKLWDDYSISCQNYYHNSAK